MPKKGISVMKKFLSIMLALLMVLSVLALSGCKKEETEDEPKPKTNAELFMGALSQLMIPEMAKSFVDTDVIMNANHVALELDELSISLPENLSGGVEIPTLPTVAFDFLKTGDNSFILSGDVTLEDETLGGKVELIDGETFYISLPEASDSYLTFTLGELMEEAFFLGENEVNSDTVKYVIGVFADALGTLRDAVLTDENLTSENVTAEVFGDEISLNKLTLKLDTDDIFEAVKQVFESLPEDIKTEFFKNLDEEKTIDELIEEAKEQSDTDVDVECSVFLDGENVRKIEFACNIAEENETVCEIKYAADILNTADTYKIDGEEKISMDGEELATVKTEGEITLKNGELKGKMNCKPEFNIPEEDLLYESESASLFTMLKDMEISVEYDGTLRDDGFDIELESELSLGGMAIKLPVTVKGELSDSKISIDADMDVSFMGAGLNLGITALVEKDAKAEKGTYDADKAITTDDQYKFDEFASEVSEYVEGLEKLSELFASFAGDDDDYDEGYMLFNICNDDFDIYFYADGTGSQYTYYPNLVEDTEGGTYTIVDDYGGELVITLTGTDTAEIEGIPFEYEAYEFNGVIASLVFTSDETSTEIEVFPPDKVAAVKTYFGYTMDDATITIDGEALSYTVDEDEGTMILDGIEFSYFSYMDDQE